MSRTHADHELECRHDDGNEFQQWRECLKTVPWGRQVRLRLIEYASMLGRKVGADVHEKPYGISARCLFAALDRIQRIDQQWVLVDRRASTVHHDANSSQRGVEPGLPGPRRSMRLHVSSFLFVCWSTPAVTRRPDSLRQNAEPPAKREAMQRLSRLPRSRTSPATSGRHSPQRPSGGLGIIDSSNHCNLGALDHDLFRGYAPREGEGRLLLRVSRYKRSTIREKNIQSRRLSQYKCCKWHIAVDQ